MPILIQPQHMPVQEQGDGWKLTTLADEHMIGTPAMTARRWSFEPGSEGPPFTHGGQEQLLYVIQGSGSAQVNDEKVLLGPETVLWLEDGDTCQFSADEQGLEILQGYVPGD